MYVFRIINNKFDDTKGVIRSCNSKKDMQYKGQEKAQSIIYKTLHRKLNIWQHELHLNLRLAEVTREDTKFMSL